MTTMAGVRGEVHVGGPLELKDGGWSIEGLASNWELDEQGDQVEPGAFAETLVANPRPPLLYAHDTSKVIGVATSLRETRDGLWGRWKISKTQLGQDVRELLRDKAVDGLSIGFRCGPGDVEFKAGSRKLKRIALYEVSVVALPANLGARVSAVKALTGGPPASLLGQFLERQARRTWMEDQRRHVQLLRLRMHVLSAGR
jgi:hypothetical protein